MIKEFSDIFKAFADSERRKLDEMKLNHGPTIGSMYEGLTSHLLQLAIPEELDLQVVSGFAYFNNELSGQLDCMLVRGKGERIPYTESYKWHIKDVLVVLEVKKTISASELDDSHDHLKKILTLFSSYVQDPRSGAKFQNIRWPRKIFGLITGTYPPAHADVESLPFDLEMLYHTLIMEYLSPVRVVIAHHGWKKERTLRNHIAGIFERRVDKPGTGAGSFPQLIIGGEFSIVKGNGLPYTPTLIDGWWPFLLSTSHNPMRILFEFILTKLERGFDIRLIEDDGMESEAMSPCITAKCMRLEGKAGWGYQFTDFSEKVLQLRGPNTNWKPIVLTVEQFVVVNRLCNGETIQTSDQKLIDFLDAAGITVENFVSSLTMTQLVVRKNSELVLATELCRTAILGSEYVAGEDVDGHFTTWCLNAIKERKIGK